MQNAALRQLIALGFALELTLMTPRGFAGGNGAGVAGSGAAAKDPAKPMAGETLDPLTKLDRETATLVQRSPQDAGVRNQRAEFLWMSGRRAEAVTEWEAAERLAPENALVLGHLGGALMEAGEMKKSAAYYERSLKIDARSAANHFALANLQFLFRHELSDAAHPDLLTGSLDHFAAAAQLAPGNADYARAYAETFYSVPSPDWTAALAAWEHFSLLSPQKDFARINLARVHVKLSQWDAARQELAGVESDSYKNIKLRLGTQIDAGLIKSGHPLIQSASKTAPGPENSSKPVIDDRP